MISLLAVNIGDELIVQPGQSITRAPQFATTGALISILLKNVYVIAGIALLFLLIFGGISIIMSAGSGDAKKAAQGQKAITNAIIGFLIVFASFWIIQIIQFVTGVAILNTIL